MIEFLWPSSITQDQKKELLDVFCHAFLPQGRSNLEQLLSYFQKKVIPRLEKNLASLALHEKRIVGFALFERWENRSYYLAEIAILPQYQSQGIGKKLVFSIFEKDQKAKKIVLVTEKENPSGQAFYEKIGFSPSSFQHPNYPEKFMGYELVKRDIKT